MEFEGLKQFFGEDGKASITYEQLSQGIASKGMKLADLSLGGYIGKDKYDEQKRKYDELKNGASKYADYEDLKAELETLKAEKVDREFIEKLSTKKVKPEFQKFVLSEIKSRITEDLPVDKAIEQYLKENPQYIENKKVFKNSSVPLENGSGEKKSTNQKMNDFIRSVRN